MLSLAQHDEYDDLFLYLSQKTTMVCKKSRIFVEPWPDGNPRRVRGKLGEAVCFLSLEICGEMFGGMKYSNSSGTMSF